MLNGVVHALHIQPCTHCVPMFFKSETILGSSWWWIQVSEKSGHPIFFSNRFGSCCIKADQEVSKAVLLLFRFFLLHKTMLILIPSYTGSVLVLQLVSK